MEELVTSAELLTSLRVAAALSGAAFLAGCDGGSVGNEPDGPLDLSGSAIDVLGSSDAFALVRDLEVTGSGSVWALNSVEPYFIGFGPDGESLGAHGRSGGGPDEFPMPSAFVTGGWEGEAWVFDIRRHAMIRISRPDADWAEAPLRSASLPPGSVRGGTESSIAPRWRVDAGGGEFRLGLLEPIWLRLIRRPRQRTLVALGEVLDDPTRDFIPSEGGVPLWYRLWASCGENLVRVHDRVRNQLRGFDASGTEVGPIDLPPVPFTEVRPRQFAGAVFELRQAELTGDVRARISEADRLRLLNQMAQGVSGSPQELASYLPRYVDFRCSEDGTMWMQPFDPDAGGLSGGPLWLRIAPDGATREVRLPDRFDAFRFSSSAIWGVYRDELDIPSVASISLPTR